MRVSTWLKWLNFTTVFDIVNALVPIVGAITMGFVYIGRQSFVPNATTSNARAWAIVLGLAIVVIVFILATIGASRGSAENVNTHNYERLTQRQRGLEARLQVGNNSGSAMVNTASCQEAQKAYNTLGIELGKPGSQWTIGTGYTGAWNLIYAAEEALIECECCTDQAAVIAEARADIDRIKNSGMDNEATLLNQLRAAILELDPNATAYLDQALVPVVAPAAPAAVVAPAANPQSRPRAMVREALNSLNEFRESQYEGMLRARNTLLLVMTWTGVAIFVLALLAVLMGAPYQSLATAMGLALLGAVVGAFARLFRQSQTPTKIQVDDLGLTGAQFIANLLYSAIAAVVGVFLTITLYQGIVIGSALTTAPPPTATPTVTPTVAPTASVAATPAANLAIPASSTVDLRLSHPLHSDTTNRGNPSKATTYQGALNDSASQSDTPVERTFPSIDAVFNLNDSPLAPVIAAIFGLTPSLLVTTLQQDAARFQINLLKSKSSGS